MHIETEEWASKTIRKPRLLVPNMRFRTALQTCTTTAHKQEIVQYMTHQLLPMEKQPYPL